MNQSGEEKTGNNSSIMDTLCGIDVRIYQNVRIVKSALGDYCSVGDGAIIKTSEIGDYCEIERRNLIRDSRMGRASYTGSNTCIMWAEIGSFCSISRDVDIGGNNHNYHAVTTMPTYKFEQ